MAQWTTLRGARGAEWKLREEVTCSLWKHVIRTMPNKASGISGVAVAQLKLAPDELLEAMYYAVMHDVEAGLISERWHKVVYVLLEKPEIVGERREIALTEHDVKVLLQAARRVCYARLLGRSQPQNLGWELAMPSSDPSSTLRRMIDANIHASPRYRGDPGAASAASSSFLR